MALDAMTRTRTETDSLGSMRDPLRRVLGHPHRTGAGELPDLQAAHLGLSQTSFGPRHGQAGVGHREQRIEAGRGVLEDEAHVRPDLDELPDLTPLISRPSTVREPSSTAVSPTIARPMVVFPDPDSPTSPTTSPGPIQKSTPLTAMTPVAPNRPG